MRALLIGFLIPIIANAQQDDSLFLRKMADDVLVNEKAYNNLRELTKNIGGRLTGSPQMVKAERWAIGKMKEAGADTVYMQECMVPHWVRGGADKAWITSADGKKAHRELNVLALGNSLGTGKKGITAKVLAVSSFDELEQKKADVKGAIVFYNAAFNAKNVYPFMSYRDVGMYRGIGASRAAKYGAAGVIVRSLTEGTDNNPHTGSLKYNDSFPKIPAVAIGLQDADYLWQQCTQHNHVEVSLTTNASFKPDTVAHNIVGEMRGTEFPAELITLGGHLDSWDVSEGAHDDGAGVVHTMEVLRVLKALHYQPKRTIRFVLFANEENGLKGGEKYTEQAVANHEKHLFALETDAGGFTPRGFSFSAPANVCEKVKTWSALLQPYGGSEFTQGGGGADISSLHKKLETPVASFVPDGQRYFDVHHAASDVFENVNKRELLLGAVNIAALIYLVDKYGL